MAEQEITINGRNYLVACEDGQEEALMRLAGHLDGRVRELEHAVGKVGEARLLVMTALLLADELEATRGEGGDPTAVAALSASARRIEAIARRIEQA